MITGSGQVTVRFIMPTYLPFFQYICTLHIGRGIIKKAVLDMSMTFTMSYRADYVLKEKLLS